MKNNPANQSITSCIGERLRTARKAQGLSQADLGNRLKQPVTFQQVQKYEHGNNRITVCRLYEFAEAMSLPIEYFLPSVEHNKYCLNPKEIELLSQFRNISEHGQAALLTFLKEMA